jgi:hypothetical protein
MKAETMFRVFYQDVVKEAQLYLGKEGFMHWLGRYGDRLEEPEVIRMIKNPFFFFKESWLGSIGKSQLDDLKPVKRLGLDFKEGYFPVYEKR